MRKCWLVLMALSVGAGFWLFAGEDTPVPNAKGTLSADGQTTELKYAFVDESDDNVIVLIADVPVAPDDVPFGGHQLAAAGKMRGLVVSLSKSTRKIEKLYNAVFHPAWEGQFGSLGDGVQLDVRAFDDKKLEARLWLDKPMTFSEHTFQYDVTFSVPLGVKKELIPIEAVVTGDDSPPARAYAACYKALMAGDIETVKKWVIRERVDALEQMNPREIIEFYQLAQPHEIRIVSVSIEGNAATLKAEGNVKDGSATGTISMILEDGAWKVQKESWSITSK